MPMSRAVDRVAARLRIPCYETPTGWKYFGNLLDAGKISICGEESFGTGSNHLRGKDGLWAVLFWHNILAARITSVESLVRSHWREYGRNYYSRHDYEDLDNRVAENVIARLRERAPHLKGQRIGSRDISSSDDFRYVDPVNLSTAEHQGIRIVFSDEARIIYRVSGTTTDQSTLRVYLESCDREPAHRRKRAEGALADLAVAANRIAGLEEMTGRRKPSVIT